MPLGDVAEQQAFIAAYFGGDTSTVPASFTVAIFTGNPYASGVEVDFPGYARVTLTNNTTTFVNNADGSVTATATGIVATDAAGTGTSVVTDDGLCWVLYNGTAITAWDFLDDPIAVDGPGAIDDLAITVYHPNTTLLGA